MRKSIKKLGLSAAICALACCSFGVAYTFNPAVDASAATLVPTLAVNDAKSIRIADDNHNGIRFTATIADYSADYEYHMVIVPENYFDPAYYGYVDTGDVVGDLNAVIESINTANSASITLNDIDCQPVETDGAYEINGSITNILYNNSLRNFVAVAYAKTGAEETSADYIYSATSTPVNVTQLSAEFLEIVEDDADTQTVLQGYVDNGLKKAAGLAVSDEVPELSIVAEDVAVTSGESVALSYKVMNGENEVVGLDGLVAKATSSAAGISLKEGKIVAEADVLTRTATVEIGGLGNSLVPDSITVSVEQPEKNIFAPVYMQSDFGYGWTPLDPVGALTRAYDETEGAMKVTMIDTNADLTGRSYILFLTLDEIKLAMSKGNNILSFEVKGDEGTAIRIYNKVKSTTNNKGNEYLDDNNLGSATTAKIYRDVVLGGSEYTTVNVNLTDFMALNANGEFMGILVQGAKGANVYFKNASFSDKIDYEKENLFSGAHVADWTVQGNVAKAYDAANSALKVTAKAATDGYNQFTSNNRRIFIATTQLAEAQAAGYDTFTFEYNAATLTDPGTSGNYGFRVCANDGAVNGSMLNSTTGVLTVSKADGNLVTTDTWTKVEINIAAVFAAGSNVKGLSIVVVGATDSYILLRNGGFGKIDYSQINLFSNENSGSWTVQGNVAKAFDSTASALKVTAKAATDGYNQFTSNNRRIFIATTQLVEAQAAGYDTFTFEYNAATLTDPGTSGNYGFRVCANPTSVNGTMLNSTVGVLTVSGKDGNLVTANTWTKVEINIATFLAEGSDVKGLSIVVVGATDSYILFRNGTFAKAN